MGKLLSINNLTSNSNLALLIATDQITKHQLIASENIKTEIPY